MSYSVTLQGWLSPLIWSIIRPYAARVVTALAEAAEQELIRPKTSRRHRFQELVAVAIAFFGTGVISWATG